MVGYLLSNQLLVDQSCNLWVLAEEFIGLDDNKYIGDLLAEFKGVKNWRNGEILHCSRRSYFRVMNRLLTLCLFSYLIFRDDAAQLSALQMLVEIGYTRNLEAYKDWMPLERYLPRKIATTRAKLDWELDILSRYYLMEHLTKEDARQQFLRILRMLPFGNSVFCDVRKINDPIGLLPGRITLGIKKHGGVLREKKSSEMKLVELNNVVLENNSKNLTEHTIQ